MNEEKPIECTSCKKKATVNYREIKNGKIQSTKYCADCPILKAKIAVKKDEDELPLLDIQKNIACPDCKTSLQGVMTGASFGCKKCYDTFEEFLTEELTHLGAIPLSDDSKLSLQKKMPLHLGNVPIQADNPDFANKLRSLNSALHEALAIENYERAANLRDEIKNLMDQSHRE